MRYIIILCLLQNIISCQSLKVANEESECPEGYECYLEVEENKRINSNTDTIGQTYLQLEGSKNTMVVKYIYKYKSDPRIADSGYSEIVYMEIPNDTKTLKLENQELENIKLYIQKICFCSDAGYKKITDGKIEISKDKNTLKMDLNFTVDMKIKLNSVKAEVEI